jgi:2-dehydro-3-deoxy-L-rhamnonate dehydrogenase (NAD+)
MPAEEIAGREGSPSAASHAASNAGVIGRAKSLDKEMATSEIRANYVTPVAVQTPIFEQMTEQQIGWMLSQIPTGRFGGIDEVRSVVCRLAREDCSFSTGAARDVSGGGATH